MENRSQTAFPEHLAIVGGGLTGTSAFVQAVEGFPVREITIFEASGDFGPGIPYRSDECKEYLLNNTNETMRLAPANRPSFVDWLKSKEDLLGPSDPKGYAPRFLFGQFLQDAFAATKKAAESRGIRVRTITAEADRIREEPDGRVRIGWSDDEIVADAAILATGRCPDLDPVERPNDSDSVRYISSHLSTEEIDDLPLDALIHVLGASLSAYDVVNRLFSPDTGCRFERDAAGKLIFIPGTNRRTVVLCSRTGRLKKFQSREPMRISRREITEERFSQESDSEDLSLLKAAAMIRREAEIAGVALDLQDIASPFRDCIDETTFLRRVEEILQRDLKLAKEPGDGNFLVDLLDESLMTFWDGFLHLRLNDEDEAEYRRRYESRFHEYAAACPIFTGERLAALLRAGRLRVLKGVEIRLKDDGYEIRHDYGVETCTTLINATAIVDRRVSSPRQSPLIRDLVEQGRVNPYRRGGEEQEGAAIDPQTFRAVGSRNIYLANMLLWGPCFMTSSAFVMSTVVERILKGMSTDSPRL